MNRIVTYKTATTNWIDNLNSLKPPLIHWTLLRFHLPTIECKSTVCTTSHSFVVGKLLEKLLVTTQATYYTKGINNESCYKIGSIYLRRTYNISEYFWVDCVLFNLGYINFNFHIYFRVQLMYLWCLNCRNAMVKIKQI